MKNNKKNTKSATKTAKTRKIGSGRTKGAVSFSSISLAELNGLFKPASMIMCSRKFLEACQIKAKPVTDPTETVKAISDVEVKVHDLSEPTQESVPTGLEKSDEKSAEKPELVAA